ncbi:hypothetical protein SAMN05444274_11137 [Mariniphaga anaerophila]|uniref:Uncharacterized protein n=1 Tax=Mariniphaga anaerophila TaxID=1484053 RepID=A0A1M5F7L6_9BACT|nr:hypothetical protein SAMN05444274_11137 [Mariniphaga anaerophila]
MKHNREKTLNIEFDLVKSNSMFVFRSIDKID